MSETVSQTPCEPPVGHIRFGDEQDGAIVQRLKEMFEEDQAARQSEPIDWERLAAEDCERRVEVMGYLEQGRVNGPDCLYQAALIFQHGNCSDHYRLANQLAECAMNAGHKGARWLYAASLDRYLRSISQPQKYGTQYMVVAGKWELQSYDPTTTDEERRRYNVPRLVDLLQYAHTMNKTKP